MGGILYRLQQTYALCGDRVATTWSTAVSSKIAVSLLTGLACGFLLNIFYVSLKHVWPENYFGLSGTVDPIVSRNLPRWAVFRLVPPVIAAAAASLTAERAEAYVWVAVGVTIIVHVQRLIRASVISAHRRYWAAAVQGAALAVVLVGLMIGATLVCVAFSPVIPEPSDLVSNIWAGFLAAIGAIYLQRIVLLRKKPRDLLRRSFAEIPLELQGYVWSKAREVGMDPRVPLAVMASENLQRPPWIRRIEHLLPRSLGATRGIMQQVGARDDRHSIDLAFERNFTPDAAAGPPFSVFERYNASAEFLSLTDAAFETLETDSSILATAERAASDLEAR